MKKKINSVAKYARAGKTAPRYADLTKPITVKGVKDIKELEYHSPAVDKDMLIKALSDKLIWLRDHYQLAINPLVSKADRLDVLRVIDDFLMTPPENLKS